MQQRTWWTVFLILLLFLGGHGSVAAKDLIHQPPVSRSVDLGTVEGSLIFKPSHLVFKVGTLYKLKLNNPSPLKHYFTAKDFTDAVWMRKVEVAGVEIKGKVNEIELKPGASVEWFFVPIQVGTYSLLCSVPGHAESGMAGDIVILE